MIQWKFYHNPKCSKSREALELLKEQGANFQIIEYLKTPLTSKELTQLIAELDAPVASLVRTKEKDFTEAAFDVNSQSVVIQQLTQKPHLMERPILQGNGRATIGRPLENFEVLLKS